MMSLRIVFRAKCFWAYQEVIGNGLVARKKNSVKGSLNFAAVLLRSKGEQEERAKALLVEFIDKSSRVKKAIKHVQIFHKAYRLI